ncbi:hypothetical protein FRC00_012215 [Tulasnella sp. 408]|nr:hypothetical protein FRC00_012215 [Tulasnella sp. 408]
MLEKRAGGRLREDPPEGTDHIEPLGLTWDPVNVWSRPGILYVFGELMNRSAKWYLEWKYNMVEREYEGIGYLIRDPSPEQPPTQSPLVLMHGLGLGVIQYVPSILLLMQHIPSDRPILIPLQPNISQAIFHPTHVLPLTRDQWVNGLKLLFEKLRWDEEGVTMVSHSKGSLIHTWMLKAYPELIKRSCFVDPGMTSGVCFCLWEGDLAWNFVYRKPTNAIQLIMKYFAATEPGIALAVQRHWDWTANALWFEEIPRPRDPYYAAYFLGGKDAVIDGWRVRRYLVNHGVDENLYWDPNGQHGQPVLDKKGLKALKDWLLAPEPKRSAPSSDSSESSEWSESEDEVLDCIIPNRQRL